MTRELITLVCTECQQKNYTFTKNKKAGKEKLALKKYCFACRKHTLHKEMK